ncbi:DUF1266 domain-containing protein [Agreia pratensis]|uniref:DUF1266 domain-containing protein n=1 Tax=Agreia pratensis TaxID=150121 RepID=UPI00188AA9B0|nr:DUF1266 domain-containing protein [Agreia pratensis]MBF4634757.1 DUF1266 domain-containing protein [Agreia pratensis]
MEIGVDDVVQWLSENWGWVAAIVVGILVVAAALNLLPDARIPTSPDFPTSGDEARDLAVGAIQIVTSEGKWNDPESHTIRDSKGLRSRLVSMWGLTDRENWLETLEELPQRRTDSLRDSLLELRAELARTSGRRPSQREWLAAAKERGASGRDVKSVINAVTEIEKSLKKSALRTVVLPAGATIESVRGYAQGQQIALATWGVALGFATREDIRPVLRQVSAEARRDFGSWEEFGRSYLLGRVMRLVEQGMPVEKAIEKNDDGIRAYGQLFDAKRGNSGPWSTLPW